MEEGEDVLGGHGTGGFEFATLLAEEEFAVGIEDGDGRDAAIEGDIVFFGDVEIFVHLADVDVDDEEGFVESGSDLGAVEGFVENVTVKAPVAAEDEEDALVGGGGGVEGVGDFGVGIESGIVDLLIVEGLAKTGGSGTLDEDESPVISFLMPALDEGDEFFLGRCALLHGERELKNEEVDTGLRLALAEEFGGEVGEALGFQGGPEGKFVGERDGFVAESGDLGLGGSAVERGKGGGIAGEDRGAPLVERSESGRGLAGEESQRCENGEE